jgi:predicted  nucleic acid-binding Zn-ribbon protein
MSLESRNVTLYCPTCGNDQFSSVDAEIDNLSDAPDDTRIQCADCKTILTKAELIEANQDVIDANLEEIKQEAIEEIEKKIKDIFK